MRRVYTNNMTKISIAFDCDGTLVRTNGEVNTKLVEFAKSLSENGFEVIVWSGGGVSYAEGIARRLGITKAYVLQKGIVKPDIVVDDVSGTKLGHINLIHE